MLNFRSCPCGDLERVRPENVGWQLQHLGLHEELARFESVQKVMVGSQHVSWEALVSSSCSLPRTTTAWLGSWAGSGGVWFWQHQCSGWT